MASLGRHTVDTPVCLPVLVADGYAEAAIVRSDNLDGFLLLALYEQFLPLAGVASPDGRLEFSCNNSLHVAGNTSTFRLQCPPTGQFPTVHERPVLEDGNYSARFLSGLETETKVCVDFTITEKAPTRGVNP